MRRELIVSSFLSFSLLSLDSPDSDVCSVKLLVVSSCLLSLSKSSSIRQYLLFSSFKSPQASQIIPCVSLNLPSSGKVNLKIFPFFSSVKNGSSIQ